MMLPPVTPLTDGAVPKHTQLRERLAELAGGLADDAPIPSERALMEQYAVSRGTVRKAVDGLIADGVLARAQGKGTYVARRRLLTSVHLASFTRDMTERGLRPTTTVLGIDLAEPPEPATAFLGPGRCWRIERLREADRRPMAYEIGWISDQIAPGLGDRPLTGSVYEVLANRYQAPIDAADQIIWAENADRNRAALLDVRPGDPLLVFLRRSTTGGRPVEYVTSWYRADRYSVRMTLTADLG